MKYFLSTLIFFSIISAPFQSAFAITSVSECRGGGDNATTLLSRQQLEAERQFIATLQNKHNKETVIPANTKIQTLQAEISNLEKELGAASTGAGLIRENITKKRAEILKIEKDRDTAQTAKDVEVAVQKCGATKANYDADKNALEEATKAAYGGGIIPSKYIPISPLPFGNNDQGIELATLISDGFIFAVGIAAFLAVVMIVYYSLSYILSGDSFSGKKFSTEKIQDSVIGFLLILASIVILRTIDPNIIYLNLDPSKPGQNNVNYSADEKKIRDESNKAQEEFKNRITSVGRTETPTTPTAPKTPPPTTVPINNTGKPGKNPTATSTSATSTKPTTGVISPNNPTNNRGPIPVIFCYKFRRKTDNAQQKKCIPSFEGCVLDKKQAQKTGAFYKFTQCKLSLKP